MTPKANPETEAAPKRPDIDLHIGQRLRRRRRLKGLTQQELGDAIGIRFQQIQKYECGANRVLASRLYELAVVLNVGLDYFFAGLPQTPAAATSNGQTRDIEADPLDAPESIELIRAYYKLGDHARRVLLDLVQTLHETRNPTG